MTQASPDQRATALAHAVRLGEAFNTDTDEIVKAAEKFADFLGGERTIQFKPVINITGDRAAIQRAFEDIQAAVKAGIKDARTTADEITTTDPGSL